MEKNSVFQNILKFLYLVIISSKDGNSYRYLVIHVDSCFAHFHILHIRNTVGVFLRRKGKHLLNISYQFLFLEGISYSWLFLNFSDGRHQWGFLMLGSWKSSPKSDDKKKKKERFVIWKSFNMGLETWLRDARHWLLLQMTKVRVTTPIQCSQNHSYSRGPDVLFWPP